jgi:hypothetical protein
LMSPRPGGSQVVVAQPHQRASSWGWAHAHGRWLALTPPGDTHRPRVNA